MKKVTLSILVIALTLMLSSCGKKEENNNQIAELLNSGYTWLMTSATEEEYDAVLTNDDHTSFMMVKAPFTSNLYEEYSDLFLNDSQDELIQFFNKVNDITVEDITNKVPDESDFEKYIGKTLGDLENDGYENTGYSSYEGVYTFDYEGPKYIILVDLKDGVTIDNIDDYSLNDLRKLEIGKITFNSFSEGIYND